jgi:hypothetical protein
MLLTMVINAVLAYSLLRPEVKISLELKSLFSILASSLGMTCFVLVYIYFFRIQTFIDLCIPIFAGALIYFALLLKIDGEIYSVVKDLLKKMEGSGLQK